MGDKDTREKQKPAGQSPVTEPVPNGASATDGLDPNTSYGDGLPLRVQPNRDSKYATANNLVAGYGSKAVEALQNYITSQLDPLWPDRTDGDSSILPNFGIDGAWGCETQAAYNALLESKGIAPCPERQGPNPCGEGVAPCGFDQSIVDKLKEKEDKDREKEEDAAFEAAAKDAREEAFSDQCLLLSHISQLQTKTDIRKRTYKNIHKIATNDPATIMNRLRMSKGGKKFLDIRHFELSELSPTIRLYKRYYDEGSRSPKEVEFKFNSFVDPVTDLQEMLSSQLQRGVGVGIERFDWTLQGVQPETTKKDIKATLSIHAQNFNELFRVRQGTDHKGKISDYRLIDLVLLQPKFELGDERPISKQRVRNPNFYEIKIVVGWAATGASSVISPELRSALKNTQLTMLLIVTDHQFDFRDDGSVKLNVYFRARMESLMLDERSDVLSDSKTRFERQLRKELVDTILRGQSELKENKRPCEDEKIEKIKEDYAKEIESERQRSYQFITQTLLETGRIHAAKLSYEDAKDLSDELSDGQQTSALEILNYICDEETLDATPGPAAPVDGERVINFFFLGDLLDVAINNVLEREELNYGNTKFVFGPMQFDDPNPKSNKQILENISNLPISVELYNHFFEDKVISQGVDSYPLLNFIRDIMRHLVFEALSQECYRRRTGPGLILDTAQISVDAKSGQDPLQSQIGLQGQDFLDLDKFQASVDANGNDTGTYVFDSFNDSTDPSKKYDYFVVYAFQREPNKVNYTEQELKSKSRPDRDFEKGIYHLTTGLDRGLVKTMTFEKTDQPYLREARFMETDYRPELQLSNVYNCKVDMFGNNLFYPGQQLFINPRGLGADLLGDPTKRGKDQYANLMGLGGYHVIKTVSNTIDSNGFSTSLDALFTTSGDGVGTNARKGSQVGDEYLEICNTIQEAIQRFENGGTS